MPFQKEIYQSLKARLDAAGVTLIAVTKTKPASDILEAYEAGHRDFGENYVQELVEKQAILPKDIRWHFIGHLQKNKVKYIAPFVHLIHGVDSPALLHEIQKQATKAARPVPCLLQVHIAREETKFGLSMPELENLVQEMMATPDRFSMAPVQGLMGMASFSDDENGVRSEFEFLKKAFDQFGQMKGLQPAWTILSMGMSSDYALAVASGSTMVRIGSMLFGARQ